MKPVLLAKPFMNIQNQSCFTVLTPPTDLLLKERLNDKGTFMLGNVTDLPFENDTYDFVVSGLALNFFPNLEHTLAEMKIVSKANGTIAANI